jgi:quercetin dioxygenase-like cupin family protein
VEATRKTPRPLADRTPEDLAMSQRTRIFIAVLSVAIVVLTGAALATPPTGFTTNVLARGSAEGLHAKHDGIRVSSRHGVSADVAVATVTIDPGGSSGWHHHPGVVLVVVQSGTVTFYDENCRPDVHRAGETFIESSESPGLAKNTGTGTAVVEATFIVPASTPPTPLRIDDPRPMRCDVT